MGRLIVIVLVVLAIVWLLKRAMAGPASGKGKAGEPPAPGTPQGDLVTCAHCKVNLPKAEARSAGGLHYCSEEHWRLGPRDG